MNIISIFEASVFVSFNSLSVSLLILVEVTLSIIIIVIYSRVQIIFNGIAFYFWCVVINYTVPQIKQTEEEEKLMTVLQLIPECMVILSFGIIAVRLCG